MGFRIMNERLSRRRFLRVSAATTLAAVALPVGLPRSTAYAAEPQQRAWSFTPAVTGPHTWESPILEPGFTFSSSTASWQADGVDVVVEVQVRDANGSWDEWTHLHVDGHAPENVPSVSESVQSGLLLGMGEALQLRVRLGAGDVLHALTVAALSFAALDNGAPNPEAEALIDGFIVPRAGWKADESWRYEGQDIRGSVAWPPSYAPIQKIIIHHTATPNRPPDPAEAIRSIYHYHAIQKDWGDIGYNFLIDVNGVVYEGRYGGANVVGGHALQYNRGSIGICLLGDFDTADPSQAMLDSVLRVIWTRAAHVDTTTVSDFVDMIDLPNLCGHGDLMPTSCPGSSVDELLPFFRGWIAGTGPIYLAPPKRRESLQILSFTIGPSTVYRANLLQVRVKVRNAGITTLNTSGPPPGYIYDERKNYDQLGFAQELGAHRICLDYRGNSGMARPWRWGLGGALEPDEERDIVGYVRMYAPGSWTYVGSVIKELIEVTAEDVVRAEVRTAVPPIARSSVWSDDGGRYFSETGHNVPPAFVRFWDANGGLRRFGYPLTEPYDEVSETDGGTWLTQYFERARFEYHPDYANTVDAVQLGLLGAEMARARGAETPFMRTNSPNDASVIYFGETGHTLRGRFRTAWEARGGLRIFGYPISEQFDERSATDGVWHTVQYFERNRFEYHPDYAGTDDEIMLGHLGREVLIWRGWIAGE